MTVRGLRSLRNKLLGVVMLTTLVALLSALAAIIGYDLRAYHQTWIGDLTAQAELLGGTTASALTFDDPRVATENLALLRARPKVRAAAIYNARGALFAKYAAPGAQDPFPRLPEADGVRIEGGRVIVFRRVVSNGEILGTVYLSGDYELAERLRDYAWIATLVLVVAMLIALAMSAWVQRIITRPILSIAGVAREVVEKRDYSRRAVKLSDDEVGTLVESFNGMLAEIERRTEELEVSNRELALQVQERTRAEQEIMRLNTGLEDRVRERTAQLETAVSEMEAFSYSVSHDLRGPLRAIDGFGQALVEDHAAQLPEAAQRHLDRIRSSTLRMAQLIDDLLSLARVSRGSLERKAVDVSDLSKQVVKDLQQREPDRSVDVSVWDGLNAEADPRYLRPALENLIGNAWKFTSRTPHPRIEIGALRDSANTVYFVRDNGAGFDMAYADKLFGTFQRLHSGNEFPGTGIGLATVRRIVQRHGGRIWADAAVGKGAVFYFTLPADGKDATAAESRA